MFAPSNESFVSSMSRDVLEEWLAVIFQENKARLEAVSSPCTEESFKSDTAAEFLLCISSKLGQTHEARYLALEIFDRFMTQHVRDLHEHVKTSDSVKKPGEEWQKVLQRVRSQIALRAVSCCCLAGKMVSNYQTVSMKKMSELIWACGHKFSEQSIIQSELRVLQTLHYRLLTTTVLDYVVTLLAVLNYNDSSLRVTTHYDSCVDLLDVFYLKRTHIYRQLAIVVEDKQHTPDDNTKQSVAEDRLLLAAAVISAASYLLDHSRTDRIVENLKRVTKLSDDDILDLATILVQLVLRGSEQ